MTDRTPFGATSTAAEVVAGLDLTGLRAIVTGAASGIGAETARALASVGADVMLAVRDLTAGQKVVLAVLSPAISPQRTGARNKPRSSKRQSPAQASRSRP